MLGVLGFGDGLSVNAQTRESLTANVAPIVLRPRSNAPIEVEVALRWESSRLLQGHLEFSFQDGREPLGSFRGGDLELTRGLQVFRLLLPVANARQVNSNLTAQVSFVAKNQSLPLGNFALGIPNQSGQAMVLAISDPRSDSSPQWQKLVQCLRIDRFDPASASAKQLQTTLTRLTPEAMPEHPLRYCQFDVVLLAGDGFGQMRRRQLDALARWVEAGGSVCVVPQGNLEPYHLEFLNKLANPDAPSFALDEKGNVAAVYDHRKDHRDDQKNDSRTDLAVIDRRYNLFRCELGRLVVITQPPAVNENFDSVGWLETTAFLWKFREDLAQILVNKGKWVESNETPDSVLSSTQQFKILLFVKNLSPLAQHCSFEIEQGKMTRQEADSVIRQKAQEWVSTRTLTAEEGNEVIRIVKLESKDLSFPLRLLTITTNPNSQSFASQLTPLLMPQTVRLIPFSLIVIVLVLFVIAIGPMDYFLLGLFKRRKLTWVLFPLLSVGFTFVMVRLSAHYLGAKDHRNTLIITDVGRGGRVLRETRFEAIFVAREQTTTSNLQNCLFTPMSEQSFAQDYARGNNPPFQPNPSTTRNLEAVNPLAVFAGRYPADFTVRQQIHQWTLQLNRTFSMEPTKADGMLNWDAITPSLFTTNTYEEIAKLLIGKQSFDGYVLVYSRGSAYLYPRHNPALATLLPQLSAAHAGSFFFQISPSGGSNLEDLSLLGPADDQQWLICVALKEQNQFHFYRKLFYEHR